MVTVQHFMDIVKSQIGYKEGPNNETKYGKAYGLDHAPWCMEFCWWCARESGLIDKVDFPHTASCPIGMEWFQNKKRFFKSPKVGDYIFFKWTSNHTTCASHVGIVSAVQGNRVYTIEGKAGSASDRVCERSYSLSYSCIVGYGRLPLDRDERSDCDLTVRVLQQGMSGNDVKQVQTMLYYGGFKGTMLKPNGDFGSRTLASVKSFQKAKGLTQDGIVGEKTWNALLKA